MTHNINSGEIGSAIWFPPSLSFAGSLSYERDARASCGALTDLPQKNVPLVYQFAGNEEERQLFKLGLIKLNNYAGLMRCLRECRRIE
jgi:hypothetical protein